MLTLDMQKIKAVFERIEKRHGYVSREKREEQEWRTFCNEMLQEQKYAPKPVTVDGIEYSSRRAARKAGAFAQQPQQ